MIDGRNRNWHGVDLDGTLAFKQLNYDPAKIGAPVEKMLARVRGWLLKGENVRIVTARAYMPPDEPLAQREAAQAILAIQDWCLRYLGAALPVTNQKDPDMIDLWDDNAVQVVPNTGEPVTNACLVPGCTTQVPHMHLTDVLAKRVIETLEKSAKKG